MGRRGHPPEFRRKVLDPVEAGLPVADVARDLGGGAESIRTWRRQHRIDEGRQPGLRSAEEAEPTAAQRRTAEPGARAGDPPPGRRAAGGCGAPSRRFEAVAVMPAEGLPVQVACRVRAAGRPGLRHRWPADILHEFPTDRRAT